MHITLLVLALIGCSPDAPAISPFDGQSLRGWVAEGTSEFDRDGGKEPVWVARDGMIVCRGKGFGFLRYKEREFDDFTLRLQFKMAPGCNSGLGIRTTEFDPKKSRATRPSFYSYEIQLFDDAGKPANTLSSGSLYRYVAPKVSAMKPAGEWNTIEITCDGPQIRVVLNDKQIQDVDQREFEALRDKPLRGYICLQNHGGDIEFRSIEVRELKTRASADEKSTESPAK